MSTGSHRGKATSWVAVSVIVVGMVLVGVAMVFATWVLFWVGVAVSIVGAVVAVAVGLLQDTPALPGEPNYRARH